MGQGLRFEVVSLLVMAVVAEATAAAPSTPNTPNTPSAQSTSSAPFTLSVGPAVEITPDYPGASAQRTFVLPDVELQYHNWLYVSGTDLIGVYAYNHAGTKAGAAIEWDFTERLQRDNAHFAGLGDVSTTPRLKLFFTPQFLAWLAGGVTAATDIGGHSEGTVAQAYLNLQLPLTARGFFTIGPGLTWSDTEYMKAFYGVTLEQSAITGFPVYAVHSGVSDVYVETSAGYAISSRWSVGIDVTVAHLQGDAAKSPFTEQRQQVTWLGTLLYKFR
jgi:MipA family protein